MNLLAEKPQPICYDGFVPSARMHIAEGVMKIINVNKLTSAGCKVNIWIEDYFACLSNKSVGGMEYVSSVGNYSIEIWKALGMNLERGKVEFLWSSEETNSRAAEYWPLVLDIARINKLNSMSDSDEAAQIIYPCLQCADIFFLEKWLRRWSRPSAMSMSMYEGRKDGGAFGSAAMAYVDFSMGNRCGLLDRDRSGLRRWSWPSAMAMGEGREDGEALDLQRCRMWASRSADVGEADICQLGMNSREVSALSSAYSNYIKEKHRPIILSNRVLPDLQQGKEKVAKSDTLFAIFMDDDEVDVNLKIKKAYCPPKVVEGNPCLEYIKYITLPWFNEFKVERKVENGGSKTFTSYEDIIADYECGELHPSDLKPALSKALNVILQPVRDHFKHNAHAKELLKNVKKNGKRRSAKSGLFKETKSHPFDPTKSNSATQMSAEEKFKIVRSVAEECLKEDELMNLLAKKPHPICYDGFEPSGRMHIAQGVMKTINVNKLTSTGCKVKMWIADWFAQLNNKMGGDMEKIKIVGEYLIEIWKAVGMNLKDGQIEFLWASEEISSRPHDYWPLVLDIAWRNNLNRIMRCIQIMGRSEQDELTIAQIFYPCMQCGDIFFLKADICQLGMDQRKVNVLAREYCDDIKRKNKPIILSHHMLPGLQQGQEKMSKSDPLSAIFMDDDEADVNVKIKQAYCPPEVVEGNPCLKYIQYLIFPWFHEFKVERHASNGSEKTFTSFEELVAAYTRGELLPDDLKPSLSKALNRILQ
ncbi:hypothetical protein RJ640_028513, partial [Escallonia rubra]